ncbi:MAG: tetratricopeptide repeat protein [Planctomycetaceae bacterium]
MNPTAYDDKLATAVEFHRLGQLDQAEAIYREIVRRDPRDANGLHLLGVLLCHRGETDSAIDHILRAIQIDDSPAVFHFNLALAYRARGELQKGLECLQKVLAREPENSEVWLQQGAIQQSAGDFDAAILSLQRARDLRPSDANVHNSLGSALQSAGRAEVAVDAYREAIRLRSDFGPFHFNLANALRECDQLDAALMSYNEAIRLDPADREALTNLGVAYRELGRFKESLHCCDRLITQQPDFAPARFNRALVLLQSGNLGAGWDAYEWRWKHGKPMRQFEAPQWEGGTLAGRSIFVHAEQGVGDEIMFASCLPDLVDLARNCVVECDPRLVPLMSRSFSRTEFIPKTSGDVVPVASLATDFHLPIGSLPRFFRRSFRSFPKQNRYLIADPRKVDLWRARLAELGSGLKVGISWRGGKEQDVRRKRSTALSDWLPIFRIPGLRFVNLQYGATRSELDEAERSIGVRLHHFPEIDPLMDLDAFASEIKALDLVISVDNSTVHLAGALGTPVWTLLPFSADWRWVAGLDNSLWYPAMRLFRQETPGKWSTVFHHAARNLEQFRA